MGSNKINISDFKFGVELEANVDESFFSDARRDGWNYHYEHCGAEIKSPVLSGYGGLLEVRRQIMDIWKRTPALTFRDCGLHVHVDIQDFRLIHLKRLVYIAARVDDVMFAMFDGTRLSSEFCRRMYTKSEAKIWSAKSLIDIQNMSISDRYDALNTWSFGKHGTIEFRYCQGTFDWQFIYSLISFYLRIVALAKSDVELTFDDLVPSFIASGSTVDAITPSEKDIAAISAKKEGLFNLLEMRGPTRKILDNIFKESMFDFKRYKKKMELKEIRENISFNMKGK